MFDGEYENLIRETQEGGIKRWLKNYPSQEILFHHRFPTSTDNVKNACHPFSTGKYFDKCYVLVHNGWITNAYELKAAHEKLGIVYHSNQPNGYEFNDSEALLWDVALYLEGEQTELKAQGAIAFIVMEIGKPNKLHFGRNSSPLNLAFDEQVCLMLSSEGKGKSIDPHQLYTYDYKKHAIEQKFLTIPTTVYATNYQSPANDWDSNLVGSLDNSFDTSMERDLFNYDSRVILKHRVGDWLFQADVKDVYRRLLKEACGHYDTTYEYFEGELETVNRCMDEMEIEYGISTLNLEYTLEVYVAVEKLLLEDPNWSIDNYFHPDYQTISDKVYQIPPHLKQDLLTNLYGDK